MYQFLKSHFTEAYLNITGSRKLYLYQEMLGEQGVSWEFVGGGCLEKTFYTITPHKNDYIKDTIKKLLNYELSMVTLLKKNRVEILIVNLIPCQNWTQI